MPRAGHLPKLYILWIDGAQFARVADRGLFVGGAMNQKYRSVAPAKGGSGRGAPQVQIVTQPGIQKAALDHRPEQMMLDSRSLCQAIGRNLLKARERRFGNHRPKTGF